MVWLKFLPKHCMRPGFYVESWLSLIDCLFEIYKSAVCVPLAILARSLQGHWWGFNIWNWIVWPRATEILKSKSVRSTDDVIRTCVRQSQIVTKTNDSSFSSKSVSEIIFLILRSLWIGPKLIWVGKKAKTCLSKFDIKFLVFVYF